MTPNAANHCPAPVYLRHLLTVAGLTQNAAANLVGISHRQMRYYLSETMTHVDAPYSVQYCLEMLANFASVQEDEE